MKKTLLFCILASFAVFTAAQDVILDKNVDEQYSEKTGPNMKRYGHFYAGIGLVVPYDEISGAKTETNRSDEVSFGYRYKIKLLSFYSVGLDLSSGWSRYGIKKETVVPAGASVNPLRIADAVEKLNLVINSLSAEAFNRINIGKRGNVIGNYLDVGIREEYNYSRKFIIKDNAEQGSYFDRSRSVERGLNFINNYSTSITARIGIDKYSIYGRYRISDIITGGYATPELPRITAGFQYAF